MDLSFVFHFMNGFDQDGVITVDWCQLSHAPLFPLVDGSDSGKAIPYLHRWTIDMNAEKLFSTFSIYAQIGFGLKWIKDCQFGEYFIPLSQTSAAHFFRFIPF